MSTLKSSDDHLTLNADGSSKNILFQADGVQKASISSAGLLTSTTIDATVLTGNLPAINGASLTNVVAASGTATDATKLPLAGGALTGALTTNSTIDGRDVAADGVLATNALPKAGGTMTGAVVGATDTDTSNSGTVDLDFTADTNFVLTLTGNITSLTASNEVAGQSGFIVFIQDGTGGRTVSLHGDYETAAGAGLTLTATASATDIVPYVVAASSRILLGTPQLAFS